MPAEVDILHRKDSTGPQHGMHPLDRCLGRLQMRQEESRVDEIVWPAIQLLLFDVQRAKTHSDACLRGALASDFDDSLIEVDAKNFARWANEGKKPRCDLAVAAADIKALGTWTKARLRDCVAIH